MLACFLCLNASLFAQSMKVTGKVSDNMGPVAGATVKVKGSNTATVTDVDGNYVINVGKNAVLEFTYLGDKTKTVKVTTASLNVVLDADVQDIDEVVVTAIGIKQEKKKLGYTTQQVTGKDLAAQGNMNVGSSLQGHVAGLTVSIPSFSACLVVIMMAPFLPLAPYNAEAEVPFKTFTLAIFSLERSNISDSTGTPSKTIKGA